MNDKLIGEITSFTLAARGRLEQEADEQLQGLYGWLKDGSFVDAARCPAINSLEEARETRHRLEQFVVDESAAGLAVPDARKKLLRETAFTWLNRLVAFRLLEDRKLIKQTISKLGDSNAFKFWLVEDANAAAYAEYLKGDIPKNAMDEGPSQVAYRLFLFAQCASLAAEVSILFDPTNLPSRLCPRPGVLKELVASIDIADIADAWKPGNEEALGWMYQAFNANEEAAIRASFLKKHKVTPDEIAAVTQLFTPRWVVRYLVENTLGRLWLEMHPDSRIAAQLNYLVPVAKRKRLVKSVRDISFLDPCCGSMHFGLVAFDIFVEMYREELEHAGKQGWPQKPSVASEDQIPSSIIAHNLFGIDLDLRAVQVSALVLFQRARSLNPKCVFSDENFACANVETITAGRLEELINATNFGNRAEERVLRALAPKVADSPNLGSLLRLERDLTNLVEAERRKLEASSQPELLLAGLTDDLFASTRDLDAFFDQLAESISARLDNFARDAGSAASHTAGEASKGVRFLRLTQRRYDVVATNPPYLDSRDYNQVHKKYLESVYPSAKRNLFAAFIYRCSELAAADGLIGMITGQSFMFIKTYEDFRNELLDTHAIETLAQYDYHLFAARVDTAAFVLRKESDKKARECNQGAYFRLVRERDADSKRIAFEAAISALRADKGHPQAFKCRQADFSAIPGKPWVYWFSPNLRDLFRRHPVLGVEAPPRVGLQTGENLRFLRKWWEVGVSQISTDSTSCEASQKTGKRWFPYMKGGAPVPWFGNQEHVVNWQDAGAEIRNFGIESGKLWSRPQNTDYYFRKGVTWSLIASTGFAARLSPGGFVFDVAGMTCFPPAELTPQTLAVLNSTAAKYILAGLNPTINYQVGDIERLPLPKQGDAQIEANVGMAVELARTRGRAEEITRDFNGPHDSLLLIERNEQQLARIESEIDAEVSRIYGLNEHDLAAINKELAGSTATDRDPDGPELEDSGNEFGEEGEGCNATWNEQTLAQAWISYALGTVLGRYAIGEQEGLGRGNFDAPTVAAIQALIDPNGVMVAEKAHPQDIVRRTVQCLEAMRGQEAARTLIHTVVGGASGDPEELLRGWLDRFTGPPAASFWKYHQQLYRNRPIYWPMQSPKKHFTAWVFHERFNPSTLFTIQRLAEDQCRLIERDIPSLQAQSATNKAAGKKRDQLLEAAADIREFSNRLHTVANSGYTFCLDDGVLLNAAPLHSLLPSWPETKKAWKELEDEKYEWAQQAMKHWPDRVKEACRTNKSFAIAHGLA